MTTDSENSNLDAVLTEVGAFGLFQTISYLLIFIPCTLSAAYQVNYMFSSNIIEYRCKIPECDLGVNNREIKYDQTWLHLAIPFSSSSPHNIDRCTRYAPIYHNQSNALIPKTPQCSINSFDPSKTVACSEYIHETDERNIQTEFNIHCEESYLLALVGTVNNIGRFIILPFNGFLSDRFGRLKTIIVGLTCGSIFGLIKSFSTSYLMYTTLEFLESLGTSTYAGTFVLALEWVSTKHRVLGSMIVAIAFPLGEILLGVVAMYIHDFRYLIRLLYTPGAFLFIYLWIVPESVLWLLVTGRVERAIKILKRTASVNGKNLSEKSIEMIKLKYSKKSSTKNATATDGDTTKTIDNANADVSTESPSFFAIFKSKKLSMRFSNCCYQFIVSSFCYYGLNFSALNISGVNQYMSFILVVLFEIPGILIAVPLLKCMERRKLMFGSLLLTSMLTVVTPLVPDDKSIIVLFSYMLAKASISCTFNMVYVFCAEQWPTNIRSSVLHSCAMVGRIGSIVAPLTIVLATMYTKAIPPILFSLMAVVGAFMALLCPETYSKKLPDTMEEAKQL